ncbi:acyl carrier protein [Thioclava sp. FTW29]|uniref:Acyl carrier protein n=1 Tax=Thioclava litoralis TaxID=3076557 RepID=A0ABZ1E5T3_9RHOB|nr:acyl carrier protein [Thioclava sp. FTW29]
MEQQILEIIEENYGLGQDQALTPDTPLLELNILDSSAFFDLIELLQAQFDIQVPLTKIVPENFADIRAIARMTTELMTPGVA